MIALLQEYYEAIGEIVSEFGGTVKDRARKPPREAASRIREARADLLGGPTRRNDEPMLLAEIVDVEVLDENGEA